MSAFTIFTKFLLFLLFFYHLKYLTFVECSTSDELRALLEFKKGIHDPVGKVIESWNQTLVSTTTDLDLCPRSFYGVVCDDNTNSISGINLEGMNLGGELKFSTLIGLKMLRNLSLAGNKFTGRLVPQLGSMSNLQYLDLSGNAFIGRIPDRMHDLWGLQYLNLSNNRFSGGYPSGIRNLQQLRSLDLHSNELWGDIGLFFSELRNVEFVDLSCNNFSGRLPIDPMNVSSLGNTVKHLNLSRNLLNGRFLSNNTLALFRNLEVLDLGDNEIGGELPPLETLLNLRVLRLSNNQFYGGLPHQLLTNSVPLQVLDLSRNGFSGSIHPINSTTLEILDLSSNKLKGGFPELSSQSGLTTLRMSNNSLEGKLPTEWIQLSRLTKVDLSFNSFTGPIPPALFSLNLIHLNLSRNQFNGAIPFPESNMGELLAQPVFAPLESLDLSGNSLTGGLSQDIGFIRTLRLLSLARNSLSGHIPGSLLNVHELESLDLSNNRFEGHLPDKLPSTLRELNLTYNQLSGILPESLRRFPPSSFHPGNEKLVIPGIGGHGGPTDFTGATRHPGSKSNIRVAIILGSIGAALMIAFVSLAYYRAQLHGFHKRSKFDGTATSRDVKLGIFTRQSLFNFHGKKSSDPSQSSLSFSNDHLLTSNSRPLSGQTEFSTEITEQAPETKPGSPLSSSPRFGEPFEQPVTLDVYSPDRFAGELYFLDASISFTAEKLSRAPAEVLGRSSYGTLYKAALNGGGLILTVKWLRVGLVKNKKEFAKEVKRIGILRHPNIVPLRAYYWGPREQETLILSDYIIGDNLALHLYESTPRRHPSLSFNQRLRIAVELGRALLFLHDRGMPHGNLKPTNIVLAGPNLTVHLTDHGLHRLMTPAGISEQILNLGALGYCAPELMSSASKPAPTLKADLYSLGVILMELVTRRSAGDIISGQSGAVDLTDWVRLCDQEGRRMDCIDKDMVAGEEEERVKVMEEMVGISLRCILAVNERPNIRQVYQDLCSLSS